MKRENFAYLGSNGNVFLSRTNVCQFMALNNTTYWGKDKGRLKRLRKAETLYKHITLELNKF